jgi:succinoglycan biosynthesis transport protein ExoP
VQQLLLEGARSASTVIGIMSALPGEGKTVIAAELASGLGQRVGQGGKVLLLDCRLAPEQQARRGWRLWPRWKSRPRISPEEIIKGLPVEQRSLASVLESSARANGLGLHDALQPLREGYRFIVLDLAAMLDDPTSSVVAREADRLYLVVRADATDAGRIQQAIQQLDDEHRGRIEGVILNRASGGSRL